MKRGALNVFALIIIILVIMAMSGSFFLGSFNPNRKYEFNWHGYEWECVVMRGANDGGDADFTDGIFNTYNGQGSRKTSTLAKVSTSDILQLEAKTETRREEARLELECRSKNFDFTNVHRVEFIGSGNLGIHGKNRGSTGMSLSLLDYGVSKGGDPGSYSRSVSSFNMEKQSDGITWVVYDSVNQKDGYINDITFKLSNFVDGNGLSEAKLNIQEIKIYYDQGYMDPDQDGDPDYYDPDYKPPELQEPKRNSLIQIVMNFINWIMGMLGGVFK